MQPGAQTSTPVDGTQGIAFTVEASAPPSVSARCPGGYVPLFPLEPTPGDEPTGKPAGGDYLLPPGCALGEISLDGHPDKGSKPTPPPGQYVRVTRIATVEVWKATAESVYEVVTDSSDHTYGSRSIHVRSRAQPFFETTIEPRDDGARMFGADVHGGGREYRLAVSSSDTSRASHGAVRVKATVYGVCEPGCTPPSAADAIQLEDASAP